MTTSDHTAFPSSTERLLHPTTEANAWPSVRSQAGLVEPLWHERHVERSGCLTTIEVPLEGPTPPPDLGPQLAAVLDQRWTGRFDLSPGAKILSVTARIERGALMPPSLRLSIVTDAGLPASGIAERRMAAELRRALRDLRRGYALPPVPLAA